MPLIAIKVVDYAYILYQHTYILNWHYIILMVQMTWASICSSHIEQMFNR